MEEDLHNKAIVEQKTHTKTTQHKVVENSQELCLYFNLEHPVLVLAIAGQVTNHSEYHGNTCVVYYRPSQQSYLVFCCVFFGIRENRRDGILGIEYVCKHWEVLDSA